MEKLRQLVCALAFSDAHPELNQLWPTLPEHLAKKISQRRQILKSIPQASKSLATADHLAQHSEP
jgi:hypothetical protein